MPLDLRIDDILTLKKGHPCGTNRWRIYRVGADIGLQCTGCERRVLLLRSKLERRARLIEREGETFKPQKK